MAHRSTMSQVTSALNGETKMGGLTSGSELVTQ